MPAPQRIDPGSENFTQLATLNRFFDFLVKQKPFPEGAIKVVQCLRFIKVNQDFIKCAAENSSDSSLYTFREDRDKGVLRDDQGTAIQVASYKGDSKACLAKLNQWVLAVEQVFEVAEKNQQLPELIAQFTYTKTTGDLEARLAQVLAYRPLPNFADLIKQVEVSLTKDDQAIDYEIVFKFFKRYYNTPVIFNGHKVMLSQKHIIDYMIKTYGYTIPNFSSSPPLATATVPVTPPSVSTVTSSVVDKSRPADAALALIKNLSAVVKVVSCPVNNSQNLNYNLKMLMDPNAASSPKKINSDADRTEIWDTFTGQWQKRQVRSSRSMAKDSSHPHYGYTKKTPVTLLQPNGRTRLFEYGSHTVNYAVGFLFDLHKLKFKTNAQGNKKYIWSTNKLTRDAWWIKDNYSQSLQSSDKSITLEQLQEQLKEAVNTDATLEHNEMLMCLCKEGLKAIFAPSDNILLRLNALRVQRIIKDRLNIELPVLIITPQVIPHEYTKAMQSNDLFKITRYGYDLYNSLLHNVLPHLATDEINQLDEAQNSLLMNAITCKNWTIVAALLNRQDIVISEQVFWLAVKNCHSDIFGILLKKFGIADILKYKFTNSQAGSHTLLDLAVQHGRHSLIALLEPELAKNNLCYAAKINNATLIAQCLATDVNSTNILDHEQNTALIWVVRRHNLPGLQLLLTAMLNKRASFLHKNDCGKTALSYATDAKNVEFMGIISACEALEKANYSAKAMFTALYKAVLTKNHTLCSILIESTLPIASTDDASTNALIRLAATHQDYAMVVNLMAAGVHGFKEHGVDTLRWALENNHLLLAQQLIEAYPTQCLTRKSCWQARIYAMVHNHAGRYDTIIRLLENHAKYNSSASFWVTKEPTQAAQLPESFKEAAAPLVMLP